MIATRHRIHNDNPLAGAAAMPGHCLGISESIQMHLQQQLLATIKNPILCQSFTKLVQFLDMLVQTHMLASSDLAP